MALNAIQRVDHFVFEKKMTIKAVGSRVGGGRTGKGLEAAYKR